MANTNLQVQDLDFDTVKEQLINYLRAKPQFTDYDFEGSSLTVLLDLLAYNTHYMGFHAHLLANEAFIDSASQKSSMTSKAKLLNYVPKSKQSAEATVTFTFDVTAGEPDDRKIIVPRGTAINSDNNASDSRQFILIDDLVVYNNALTVADPDDYTSEETLIYEGSFDEESFLVDKTLTNQRFIIRSTDIDINTLKVDVYATRLDTEFETYTLADDFTTINGDSKVFFLSVNEDDYYEIFFGNGVYGKDVESDNKVTASFVTTTGELGNNARVFTLGDFTYPEGGSTSYPVTIVTISNSEGGLEAEDVESLRFNIPYHYRRQNRAVTVDDYRNIVLSEYRNVNSVNVWGGEDNDPVTYGKVFISIKPIFGEVLSSKAKENLVNNIIRRHNIVTVDVEVVDPDYLYVNLDVAVRYNPVNTSKSIGQVTSEVSDAIDDYNINTLNKFGGFYSNSELNNRIKLTNTSILTSYTDITLEKRFTPALNTVGSYFIEFLNEINLGTTRSDEFVFRLKKSYFTDDREGNIIIYWYNDLTSAWVQYEDETFGIVNYTTGKISLTDFEPSSLYVSDGILKVFAQPRYPDFFTQRNNIVVIDNVEVVITPDYENENV